MEERFARGRSKLGDISVTFRYNQSKSYRNARFLSVLTSEENSLYNFFFNFDAKEAWSCT